MGWTGQGSNPDWGEIFHTHPDRPWGTLGLLHSGHLRFPGVKWVGRGVDHPPPPSADVKERGELYFCSLSGPSRPMLRLTLPSCISVT